MNHFMDLALAEGFLGARNGAGGPFGAVIVKDDEVIARAHNMVLSTQDPTQHAEIAAIRAACKTLGRFDLSDCVIYSTCKPCPMCLGAIFWAKIPELYFGCTDDDASDIGFDDKFIYDAIKGNFFNMERLSVKNIDRNHCLKLFEEWVEKADKKMY